jgi:hypothetical protein
MVKKVKYNTFYGACLSFFMRSCVVGDSSDLEEEGRVKREDRGWGRMRRVVVPLRFALIRVRVLRGVVEYSVRIL